jgi:hypothetical protein
MSATVIKEFRDAHDYSTVYKVGGDVSHFDTARIKRLVSLGYVSMGDDAKKAKKPVVNPDTDEEKILN